MSSVTTILKGFLHTSYTSKSNSEVICLILLWRYSKVFINHKQKTDFHKLRLVFYITSGLSPGIAKINNAVLQDVPGLSYKLNNTSPSSRRNHVARIPQDVWSSYRLTADICTPLLLLTKLPQQGHNLINQKDQLSLHYILYHLSSPSPWSSLGEIQSNSKKPLKNCV